MKYRKKPVVIEAHQYDGTRESASTIIRWAHAGLPDEANAVVRHDGHQMTIRTLEGNMTASKGDYIIRGVKGELYPCKPDIFAATYEPVEEDRNAPTP